MVEKNNFIAFIVVGILIGAAAGAAAGYLIGNGSENDETAYWFYLDYQGAGPDNVWISTQSSDKADAAFKKALDENDIEYEISETGWVTSIGGVTPAGDDYWAQWLRTTWDNEDLGVWAWETTPGLNKTIGNIFYFGITGYDPVTNAPLIDPDSETAWKTGGPFSAQ